ncbi:hypothetical protein VTN00DRAFT_2743 [Thermoascus crustaceus]|uniref:uncharacterized protein n=1 Tax=Thermoascus crustaceus TaxID=5088 RepID=UPI003742ED69
MRALVRYVEQGGIIETHDDIPDTVRKQLYAEERQRLEKQHKAPNYLTTGSMLPPININVLPTQSSQSLVSSSSAEAIPPVTGQPHYIEIPGPLEDAVEECTNWQLSWVNTEIFTDNIERARDIVLENCLDLNQILHKIDPNFFIKQGMKIGVAHRFVRDITLWLERHKQEKDSDDGW